MKIRKLYWSEMSTFSHLLQHSRQPLPFFLSHQESHQDFLLAVKKQNAWIIEQGQHVYFLVAQEKKKKLEITNISIYVSKNNSVSLVPVLEMFGRYLHKECLKLTFAEQLSDYWQAYLLTHGFEKDQWNKVLHYRTALVLGGGGAHGAYQIGAWEALQEENIPFDLIIGTSVGALNGALIMQAETSNAKKLWEELATNKVLDLPDSQFSDAFFKKFVQEGRLVVQTALKNKGVSTQALRQILENTLDRQKINASTKEFYTVSTRIKDFQETITDMRQLSDDVYVDWLLASASFFPVMTTQTINNVQYMDGGYRNNVPVDVAIEKGATEVLIIDVKGPGHLKKYKPPVGFIRWACTSHWTLGSFLLFDGKRNQLNLQLGYLEMKKTLRLYQGNWYTFEQSENFERSFQSFFDYLTKKIGRPGIFLEKNRFWLELRNLYKERVIIENSGLVFLELIADYLMVSPFKAYTIRELQQEIVASSTRTSETISAQFGATEWFSYYKEQTFFSKRQQIKKIVEEIQQMTPEELKKRFEIFSFPFLVATYITYLKEEF